MERQEVVGGAAGGAAGPRDPWDLPDVSELTIGVLGGTGEQGRGLATRWAVAGQRVIIGSRQEGRAQEAAAEVGAAIAPRPANVTGMHNEACAAEADIVLLAVPWSSHAETLAGVSNQLRGKILIDCVNPLGFDKRGAFAVAVPEGSAAQQAAALLPETWVVAAFHHISAKLLLDLQLVEVASDVMVLGDERSATDTVAALAALIPGMRGIYAGRLRNAGQVEALTANLISINRRYRTHAGVAVTGL